ncbi:sterol desaturase family protein [Chitinophaga pendula]|uniref:sterol desaturase family protein n=1 Tax=Chitinophaga TaxID=79328 RepID=UPI000BB08640|nr:MULTISPECIES: sterol desaturase family protein [Chitinophaga]ASZ13458.1 sterol desaturase [Chitinophaga sp. MD30]UCJ08916.1 sterol desaturase family protein [Chitinophaga pendula]
MTEQHLSLTITYLFSMVILLSLAEMYFSHKHDRKLYTWKDTWTNIYLSAVNFVVNACVKVASFLLLDYCYRNFRLFVIPNVFLYWAVLVIMQDFLYWLLHYVGHISRFFWAVHVTHHSSEHFNLTTGFRSTVFEPLYRMFFFVPLALMGYNAVDIMIAYFVTQIYGNLVHTQTIGKLHPIIEYIFVTPSHHRVHHARNVRYLDKNMGMLFILWDRMFGTFQEELPEDKVAYGLFKPLEDKGPSNIIFHEFIALRKDMKRTGRFMEKLKYIFYAPGWSHDDTTLTAKKMQRQLKEDEAGIAPANSLPTFS